MAIKVKIDNNQILAVQQSFDLDEKELKRAFTKALRKAQRWMHSQSLKSISKETGISQKMLRNRIKYKAVKNLKAIVFEGLNRMALMLLKAKQIKKGVRTPRLKLAASAFIKSAFIGPVRKGSKKLVVYKRVGKKRLPVDEHKADFENKAKQVILNLAENKWLEQFYIYFQQEAKWQLQLR